MESWDLKEELSLARLELSKAFSESARPLQLELAKTNVLLVALAAHLEGLSAVVEEILELVQEEMDPS